MSCYPVSGAVLAVPIYLPAVLRGEAPESPVWTDLDKASAAVIVALSALFLYLALLQLTTLRMALLVTASYAFGTSSLSVSSQALWQHGPSRTRDRGGALFSRAGARGGAMGRRQWAPSGARRHLEAHRSTSRRASRCLRPALPPEAGPPSAGFRSPAPRIPALVQCHLPGERALDAGPDSARGALDGTILGGVLRTPPQSRARLVRLLAHLSLLARRIGQGMEEGRGSLYFGPRAWGPCSLCSCTPGGGLGGVDTPSGRGSWPTSLPCWRSASTRFARD